jgi:hypothetical protein
MTFEEKCDIVLYYLKDRADLVTDEEILEHCKPFNIPPTDIIYCLNMMYEKENNIIVRAGKKSIITPVGKDFEGFENRRTRLDEEKILEGRRQRNISRKDYITWFFTIASITATIYLAIKDDFRKDDVFTLQKELSINRKKVDSLTQLLQPLLQKPATKTATNVK